MRLSDLRLSGFRNYTDASFSFTDGVNMIVGENGIGKTNLLEAVYLLSGNRSFRSFKSAELINFEKDRADIIAHVFSRGRDFEIKIALSKRGKGSVFINDVRVMKKSAMSDVLRCVVFSPKDLMLIKGAASERRGFADCALCQKKPGYAETLSRFERVLQSKQKLLRDEGDLSVLPELDLQLSRYGAELIAARAVFVRELSEKAAEIHKEISGGKEELVLKYKTVSAVKDPFEDKKNIEKLLIDHYAEMRPAEIKKLACLSGAHKDDIEVFINGREAKAFASQGQSRTAAIALKFSERELLRDEGRYPLLLLDDVMSELDAPRRKYISRNTREGQTLITCCEKLPGEKPDNMIEIKR